MTERGRPEVVVVVPWGGDQVDLLLRQLDALMQQDIPEPLEIRVAVNHAVAPEVEARLIGFEKADRVVQIIDATTRSGAAFARNRGASPAAPILLFCDADDEVDSGWASAMVTALRNGADIVGGVLDYSPLNSTPFALSRAKCLPIAFRHLPFSPSASLGIIGSLFESLQGFDETFASGEDIDLCWRAQYAGARLTFAADARTAYRLRQTWSSLFDQGRRYGRSDVQLYLRHRTMGMARSPIDSLEEVARVVMLSILAIRGLADRLKLAAKLGTILGHVEGSARGKVIFL